MKLFGTIFLCSSFIVGITWIAGCADSSGENDNEDSDDSSGGDSDSDSDSDTSSDDDDDSSSGECDPAPDLGDYSQYDNAHQVFELLNHGRGTYGGEPPYGWHDRWKGIPWEGDYHNDTTWPVRFNWDHDLSCLAQEEADNLAAGSSPQGVRIDFQNGSTPYFWIDGLNTADWRLTWDETPGASVWAIDPSNGSARMGFFYHDFDGDGPAIKSVGIGAAADSSGKVWWVLQGGTTEGSGPDWKNTSSNLSESLF